MMVLKWGETKVEDWYSDKYRHQEYMQMHTVTWTSMQTCTPTSTPSSTNIPKVPQRDKQRRQWSGKVYLIAPWSGFSDFRCYIYFFAVVSVHQFAEVYYGSLRKFHET